MSRFLFNCDFRELIAKMPDACIDLILTDPPYGETSLLWDRWVRDWPEQVRRLLKPSGSMWVFSSTRMFMENAAQFSNYKFSHDVIWEKQNGSGLFNDRFRRVHESALHFYQRGSKWRDVYKCPQFTNDATARTVRKKGRPAQWIGATGETMYVSEDGGPRLMRSVQYVRNMHARSLHPTHKKPDEILEPLLLYGCPVLAAQCSILSWGPAAVARSRRNTAWKFIGCEISPDYFAVTQERLQ